MGASLAKLSQLPDETQIFFGHEYSRCTHPTSHPTSGSPRACLPARPPAPSESTSCIRIRSGRPTGIPVGPSGPSHWDPTWPEQLPLGSHLARAGPPTGIPLGPARLIRLGWPATSSTLSWATHPCHKFSLGGVQCRPPSPPVCVDGQAVARRSMHCTPGQVHREVCVVCGVARAEQRKGRSGPR